MTKAVNSGSKKPKTKAKKDKAKKAQTGAIKGLLKEVNFHKTRKYGLLQAQVVFHDGVKSTTRHMRQSFPGSNCFLTRKDENKNSHFAFLPENLVKAAERATARR